MFEGSRVLRSGREVVMDAATNCRFVARSLISVMSNLSTDTMLEELRFRGFGRVSRCSAPRPGLFLSFCVAIKPVLAALGGDNGQIAMSLGRAVL